MNPQTDSTPTTAPTPAPEPAETAPKRPISMHEDVPVWRDCCSCEAEPYWREIAEEMGIDPDA
jgi:hypothetical protein